MDFYRNSIQEAFDALHSSPKGLSHVEVYERRKVYGSNELKVTGEPLWKKLVQPFASVFMAVLAIAATVSMLHGEYIDAIIIWSIMLINALIYYVQRFSTERILRALMKKNTHLVDVIRDGRTVQKEAYELVPGDIIILDEGEKIPADARIIEASSLRVDESQLTGESLPIEKQSDKLPAGKELYERTNMVYQGSFVIGGQAQALVVATGSNTEFGKLAALSMEALEQSPVQKKIDKLLSIIIRVIVVVAALAFVLSVYRGMDMADALRYVLALSVSAVPESLPVAIIVVLVLGMRRMAAKKALVKSPEAIETLGILTMIATDKTGTLTENRLTVQHIWSLTGKDKDILTAMAHSILPALSKTRDPLDSAMENYVNEHHIHMPKHLTFSLPFDQQAAMSGNRYSDMTLWVKGSPEAMIDHSTLSDAEKQHVHNQVKSLAAQGLRILCIGNMTVNKPITTFDDIPKTTKIHIAGLIGIADVLRETAIPAIRKAQDAGVGVCMITGDHFETAFHIGKQLGIIDTMDQVFDSRKMQTLTDEELEQVVKTVRVFARVIPENKHRLLAVLKKNHITAMTGDGVNDVPALTNAHVGIAMGSGTSIAKEAGDIILLDNNFRSILTAIAEGRTIYANIKRMVLYLISTNTGEVIVALGALIMGVPIPIAAVQILWVNLATDSCMVIPLGLEPGGKHVMNSPPYRPHAPLFSPTMYIRMLLIAMTMGMVTLTIYLTYLTSNGVEYARTLAFNALVVMQWANALNVRSEYESIFTRIRIVSIPFYIGLAAAITLQILAMSGFLHEALHLTEVSLYDICITSLLAFALPIIVVELHKYVARNKFTI